jgi:hypothetical protein
MVLEATVWPPDAAPSVTFKIGAQVLGRAPVVAGKGDATVTVSK